jgi:cobalamin-dependent methionine synthase I
VTRLSQSFIPTEREAPADAEALSHKLLVRAGMVRQTGAPRVLLTTFPGEQHGLGLLMVEALLVPEGAQCISLGTQTPIDDIRGAALAHKAHIVALSFSAAFPLRQAGEGLAMLRRHLSAPTALWAGGEMTRRLRKSLPGVRLIGDLADVGPSLRTWRTESA